MALKDYLGEQFLGILAAYQPQGIVHHIGVVYPRSCNQLRVFIPKGPKGIAFAWVTCSPCTWITALVSMR